MRGLKLFLVAACLSFCAGAVYSAQTVTALVESHLKDSTILNASVGKLSPAVVASVSETPQKAPEIVYAVLAGGRADSDAIASMIVTAAIQGLPKPPSSLLIAQIVEAAVKATPDSVLKIVKAAVHASPQEAAPAIVRSAVASLPNPDELGDLSSEPQQVSLKGFKDWDYKDTAPAKNDATTPAEKILQAALQADPNLDPTVLQTAVNQGLEIQTSTPVDNSSHFAIWPPVVPLVSH